MIFFQTGDIIYLKKKYYWYNYSLLYDNIGIVYNIKNISYLIYAPNPYENKIKMVDIFPTKIYDIYLYKCTQYIQSQFEEIIPFLDNSIAPSNDWLRSQLYFIDPDFNPDSYTHWSSLLIYVIWFNIKKIKIDYTPLTSPPQEIKSYYFDKILLDI